ncbi:glycosyl transferase [Geomonas silvestris]|uniref:Glycosyl transferase n=1 Tax=Geomonas silvestris TaxID=2740184 RepID=A0A6V8MKB8_9BACT|nr:glycosyltransferase [Geomonas silvestris]GFO60183.1 glycosyl transferase [Geomonas silvestris]
MHESIVVFSHLRWDFVYQRPQHLLARMAKLRPIIFIEEPIHQENSAPFFELSRPEPGVLVCKPVTPSSQGGFHDEQIPWIAELLGELLAKEQISHYLAWFYTPMALPLLRHLRPQLVVYDCMDELSGFLKAPRQLTQREAALLKSAHLVFTGGRSLYEAKKGLHPAVHCFPSSVDAAHFAKALDPALDHPLQRPLPRPRLGFYGVLDERLDLALLHALAKTHPGWQIVLVGPVVKIAPETLPKAPNIHYFGKKEYTELPAFLSGWDVCILPFALNEATRYISPTKTLEYMAAEKPVVSTPITDVVRPYGEVVFIGRSIAEFITGCEQALRQDAEQKRRMVAGMRRILSSTSWDSTVEAMDTLIRQALRERTAAPR